MILEHNEHNDVCLTVNMKDPVEEARAPVRVRAEMVGGIPPGDFPFSFEKREARSSDEGGETGIASQV